MTWRLTFPGPVATLNSERKGHWSARHTSTAQLRTDAAWAARFARIPACTAIEVTIEHHRRDARSMPDVGACFPAAKAVIDGLVDAGVIPDDGPKFVRRLTFLAPQVSGKSELVAAIDALGGGA